MKRIISLVVAFMFVAVWVNAEGNYIPVEEAVVIARTDLQAYGGFTEADMDNFVTIGDDVEDWSFKRMGISRRVCSTYDAHPSLPELSLTHFISATDGKLVKREDGLFESGDEFARYYHSLAACGEFLYAQEALEEKNGPFRTWTESQQQDFYAQYGNHEGFLKEHYYPLPTDIQSWEARRAADQFMIDQCDYTEEAIEQFEVETKHRYMEFHPNFWFVVYSRANALSSEVTLQVHYENGVILEVTEL